MMKRSSHTRWVALLPIYCWALLAHAGPVTVEVRDAAGRPLPNAVVQLDSAAASRAVRAGPPQSIVQRDRRFTPAVTVVTPGTAVHFPNQDTVRHHVYSFSSAKRFELKLYIGTPASPVVFDRPGLVVLGCNIHDEMIAWVHVVNTPYHGTTDNNGLLTLPNVVPGAYQLQTWHPRLAEHAAPTRQTLHVPAQAIHVHVTLSGLLPP